MKLFFVLLMLFVNTCYSLKSIVPGTVVGDWLGNTSSYRELVNGRTDSANIEAHKWVQDYTSAIWVSKNGTVYAYSNWDESKREIGIYKDGESAGQITSLHTRTSLNWGDIVGDDSLIYSTSVINFGNWDYRGYGILVSNVNGSLHAFYNGVGDQSSFIQIRTTGNTALYMKLAIDYTTRELFVTDTNNLMYVYDLVTKSSNRKATFTMTNLEDIVTDNNGKLWVIQSGQIKRYSSRGVYEKTITTGALKPTKLAYTKQNELMVWDDSTQQIYFYKNLNLSNPIYRTVGIPGGTYTSNGAVTDNNFFPQATGIGVDSVGNYYISWGYGLTISNTNIRKYNKNNNKVWDVYSHVFVGIFTLNEELDGKYAYSSEYKYEMDWSKPVGKKWKYVGFTLSKTEPDPIFAGFTGSRFVNGKLILFKTMSDLSCNGLKMYGEKGSQMVPAFGFLRSGTVAWFVDKNGDVWWGDNPSNVIRYKFQGYKNGYLPIYDTIHPIKYAKPDSGTIRRLFYNEQTDEMVFSGMNGNLQIPQQTQGIGNCMFKYSNWSKSTRKIEWFRPLDIDTSGVFIYDHIAMWVTKDYIFTVSQFNEPRNVNVYRVSDGTFVGAIYPTASQGGNYEAGYSYGQFGWVDIPYGIHAIYRSNGTYVITIENDLGARTMMYIWCPSGNCQ